MFALVCILPKVAHPDGANEQLPGSKWAEMVVCRQQKENHRRIPTGELTVLAVVGDLHLALLGAQESLGHLGHGVPAGELAVQEVARARPLHDIRPGEARHLAEAVVAVDDGAVLHAGIGDDEFLIWKVGEEKSVCVKVIAVGMDKDTVIKTANIMCENVRHTFVKIICFMLWLVTPRNVLASLLFRHSNQNTK